MKKRFVVILLGGFFFVITGILIGCGETTAPIKIGIAGPYTGDLAPYGIPTLKESQRLAEIINAKGGINGHLLELIPADDACDPAQAANLASKYVDEQVVVVLGHICSGATTSALSTYVSAGIPVISPSATNPSLTKSGNYPIFFRVIAPDDTQGATQAEFLVENLKVHSVAVIHDKQDYGKGLADSAKASLEGLGTSVPVYEGITTGAVDYLAVASKIVNAGVDAVVFGGYPTDGSKLIVQLRDKGYEGAFITSGDGAAGDDFISLAGNASEGVYASGPQDKTQDPAYQAAVKAYKAKYNENPGAFFNEGHAAFQVIQQALRDIPSNTISAATVLAVLTSGRTFDTTVGNISFDSNGDAVGVGFNMYQVVHGAFTLVK